MLDLASRVGDLELGFLLLLCPIFLLNLQFTIGTWPPSLGWSWARTGGLQCDHSLTDHPCIQDLLCVRYCSA